MTDVFECNWARNIHSYPNDAMKARDLVAYALTIRMYGERAPGGKENWRDWEIIAEDYMRATGEML